MTEKGRSMKVLNRQNQLVDFDPAKLFAGILKASDNTNESSQLEDHKEEIIQGVLDKLLEHGVKHPTTVDINSAIPEVLMEKKFYKTADSFIKYATIHKMERANHKVDPITTIDEYINRQDWRIKANANQGYSVGGMILNASGKLSANYWLDNIYPEDAGFAHRNGDIHLHDLDMICGYCFSKDTEIKTKEYGNISMEELERKGHNNIFTVYSKDFNGNIIETKALFARKTRSAEEMEELLEIEFEDGSKVRCTQEHLFMLKDGTYKAAYMLTNMDELAEI